MTRKVRLCPRCHGSGRIPCMKRPGSLEQCTMCKGSGRVWEIVKTNFEPYED